MLHNYFSIFKQRYMPKKVNIEHHVAVTQLGECIANKEKKLSGFTIPSE